MRFLSALLYTILPLAALAQENPIQSLVTGAKSGAGTAGLADQATKILGAHGGTAVWEDDFLFVKDSDAGPVAVSVDFQPAVPMTRIAGSNLWMRMAQLKLGATHAFQYYVDGKPNGNRGDVAGYNSGSYPQAGVPKGQVSEKHTLTSKIYDGMKADFWFYAAPGIDANVPAPVMIWQDGQNAARGDLGPLRLFTVTENLVAQKRIPPMVHIMIAPGTATDGKAMRSVEYDTVSDKYDHFLLEEVLPEVEKVYKLRHDGYSRAIAGESSGGICSLNAAWWMPDQFARVHSAIGSFTSIQWHPELKQDGGNLFPFMVRKLPKRNIRMWMSDGSDDLENDHGSWPLQNIELANSLKRREYDFHFRFGVATHDSAQAALDLPESLAWLWRGYDAGKTNEDFVMEAAEKDKPLYRVTISNRDAW
jgi:enterochelin esterase-like enzyme